MPKYITILLLTGLLAIASCGHDKDKKDDKRPVETIYTEAMENLKKDKYRKSIEQFEDVERNYPYSKWATNAQLMAAYARYQDEQYDDAVIALERFIKLHPGNSSAAYAYYLKALCHYERISTINRDQSFTGQAKDALKEVVARFPDTAYSRDANIKLDLVLDHLAGKEVEVGRFYLKNGQYIAAINRFQEVIASYQTTSQIPEALHRLVESHMALGIPSEAKKYAAVLGHNYPGSKWYGYSYALLEGKDLPEMVASTEPETSKPATKKSWFKIPFLNNKKRDLAPPPVMSVEGKEPEKIQ
jgi:outer membrane protein assembly factor BamD